MDEFEDQDLVLDGSQALFIQSWIMDEPQKIKGIMPWSDPEDIPLRIGLAGAHGNDKTTIAKSLATKLDIPLIHNVARTANRVGAQLNKKSTVQGQVTIWLAQFYEQLQVAQFVSDRTLIDIIAYLMFQAERKDPLVVSELHQSLLTALTNVTSDIVNHEYSVVFYIPLGQGIKPDGVRSIDRNYQKAIDKIILQLLEALDVDYIPLTGVTRDKINMAINYLTNAGLIGDTIDPLD